LKFERAADFAAVRYPVLEIEAHVEPFENRRGQFRESAAGSLLPFSPP
jgi:hypothetical protein